MDNNNHQEKNEIQNPVHRMMGSISADATTASVVPLNRNPKESKTNKISPSPHYYNDVKEDEKNNPYGDNNEKIKIKNNDNDNGFT